MHPFQLHCIHFWYSVAAAASYVEILDYLVMRTQVIVLFLSHILVTDFLFYIDLFYIIKLTTNKKNPPSITLKTFHYKHTFWLMLSSV